MPKIHRSARLKKAESPGKKQQSHAPQIEESEEGPLARPLVD